MRGVGRQGGKQGKGGRGRLGRGATGVQKGQVVAADVVVTVAAAVVVAAVVALVVVVADRVLHLSRNAAAGTPQCVCKVEDGVWAEGLGELREACVAKTRVCCPIFPVPHDPRVMTIWARRLPPISPLIIYKS